MILLSPAFVAPIAGGVGGVGAVFGDALYCGVLPAPGRELAAVAVPAAAVAAAVLAARGGNG